MIDWLKSNLAHMGKVRDDAKAQDALEALEEVIKYLDEYGRGNGRAVLGWDFAPMAFSVEMEIDGRSVWYGAAIYWPDTKKWTVNT